MWKKLLALTVSLSLLAVIYWKVDLRTVWRELATLHLVWVGASLALFVPLLALMAWRLKLLVPGGALGLWDGLRLILAASVLNLVLPAKMGDLAKAWWIRGHSGTPLATSVALVVFERFADLLALCFWACCGVAFYHRPDRLFWSLAATAGVGVGVLTMLLFTRRPALAFLGLLERVVPVRFRPKLHVLTESWVVLLDHVGGARRLREAVLGLSLGIELLQLVQIWVFTRATGAEVPLGAGLSLNAFAILIGLVPLSFAGVGTRDAALVVLYRGLLSPAAAAVTGLFCTVRYLVPALAGLPFLHGVLTGSGGSQALLARAAAARHKGDPPEDRSPSSLSPARPEAKNR